MTAEEYRGYTVEGTLKTLGEIDIATSKVMMILALPSMIKNAVKTTKDFANGVPFDTSIGAKSNNKKRKQLQNTIDIINENTTKCKPEYKKPVSGKSGKEAAKDVPSWAKGNRPYKDENGNAFAKRLLDERYGPGNYYKGTKTEYNQIRKWGDRGFE